MRTLGKPYYLSGLDNDSSVNTGGIHNSGYHKTDGQQIPARRIETFEEFHSRVFLHHEEPLQVAYVNPDGSRTPVPIPNQRTGHGQKSDEPTLIRNLVPLYDQKSGESKLQGYDPKTSKGSSQRETAHEIYRPPEQPIQTENEISEIQSLREEVAGLRSEIRQLTRKLNIVGGDGEFDLVNRNALDTYRKSRTEESQTKSGIAPSKTEIPPKDIIDKKTGFIIDSSDGRKYEFDSWNDDSLYNEGSVFRLAYGCRKHDKNYHKTVIIPVERARIEFS